MSLIFPHKASNPPPPKVANVDSCPTIIVQVLKRHSSTSSPGRLHQNWWM